MLAASLSRAAFEKAMAVKDGAVMPAASLVGYPAEKKSIRESLMRKGLKAYDLKPFDQLFFKGDFKHPLPHTNPWAKALEMARWAPSAANGQPWRAAVDGDSVHFHEAKRMKESPPGDIQKVDVGVALAHFDMTLEEEGVKGTCSFSDPGSPRLRTRITSSPAGGHDGYVVFIRHSHTDQSCVVTSLCTL